MEPAGVIVADRRAAHRPTAPAAPAPPRRPEPGFWSRCPCASAATAAV